MSDSADRPDAYTFDGYLDERLENEAFAEQWAVDEVQARFAYRTFKARAAKGWSQEELAERVGTGQSNISDIEHAVGNPTLKTMARIAAALEVDIVDLLRPDGEREMERVFVRFAESPGIEDWTAPPDEEKAGWPGEGVPLDGLESAIMGQTDESSEADTVAA